MKVFIFSIILENTTASGKAAVKAAYTKQNLKKKKLIRLDCRAGGMNVGKITNEQKLSLGHVIRQ